MSFMVCAEFCILRDCLKMYFVFIFLRACLSNLFCFSRVTGAVLEQAGTGLWSTAVNSFGARLGGVVVKGYRWKSWKCGTAAKKIYGKGL